MLGRGLGEDVRSLRGEEWEGGEKRVLGHFQRVFNARAALVRPDRAQKHCLDCVA